MPQTIGEILGKIERDPIAPGSEKNDEQKVRYVSYKSPESPFDLFNPVITKIYPKLPRDGAINSPPVILETPDKQTFFPFRFFGDVEGWQLQIEKGAAALGRVTAKISSGKVITSEGRSFDLSDCNFTFLQKFTPASKTANSKQRRSQQQ